MRPILGGWVPVAGVVGAAQGILLAGVLLAQRSNRIANRLLAALMASFALYLIVAVLYATDAVRAYPHSFGVSYPLPWIFGPLVFLYSLAAADRAWRPRRHDWLHFAPAALVVLAFTPIYLMSGTAKLVLLEQLRAGQVPALLAVIDPTKYVSGIAYTVVTVMHLRRHRRRMLDSYADIQRVNLRWLLMLSLAVAGVWALALVVRIANLIPAPAQARSNGMVVVAMALLVYAIGFMGLRQPEIFRYDNRDEGPGPSPPDDTPLASGSPDGRAAVPPAARLGFAPGEIARLKSELIALMERERPYCDPELNLGELAGRLGTTPHKLSAVLNGELDQTFYDFVNGYRVEEVRRRMGTEEARRRNLLTLAMDAGFASKSTFNEVFKKQTGQTPSTYRRAAAG